LSRFISPIFATAASSASRAAATSGGTAIQIEPMFETLPAQTGATGAEAPTVDKGATVDNFDTL
jgi:hypothetical protein